MNYIHHYDFELNSDIEIKKIIINGATIFVIENIFKNIKDILNIVKNNSFYHQPENAILPNVPWFHTSFVLKEFEFLIKEIVLTELKSTICLNCYVIDKKIQTRLSKKPHVYHSKEVYRGTFFINETNGIKVYKNKHTDSIFYDKEFQKNYDLNPVFLDDFYWNQWEEVLHLDGKRNSLCIYPMKLFAFIDFTKKLEKNRYTMEFVFS